VKPELVAEYVEGGTLRFVWRDFAYQGQESVNAALAARAAQEQGKFWEYHDLLYQNQSSGNSGGYADEKLVELARKTGLDVERFEEALRDGRYEEVVRADLEEAQRKGISGTPAFEINGELIFGLQSQETFREAIEQAEREAEGG
jgi:protein-disulfide isomerase